MACFVAGNFPLELALEISGLFPHFSFREKCSVSWRVLQNVYFFSSRKYLNSNLRFRLRVQTFSKDACRHLGWGGIENEEKLTAEEAQKVFPDNFSRGPQLINYAFNGLSSTPLIPIQWDSDSSFSSSSRYDEGRREEPKGIFPGSSSSAR